MARDTPTVSHVIVEIVRVGEQVDDLTYTITFDQLIDALVESGFAPECIMPVVERAIEANLLEATDDTLTYYHVPVLTSKISRLDSGDDHVSPRRVYHRTHCADLDGEEC